MNDNHKEAIVNYIGVCAVLVVLLFGIAVLLISTPLISVAARAWTEALFIFLAIMAIMEAAKFQKNGANRNLLISGTFAGLSFLTRFVGITVIGTCVLLILLNRDASPQRRIAKVSIYSITSAAPTFIWISRNFLISGTVAGDRNPSRFTLPDNLVLLSRSLVEWFLPPRIPTEFQALGVLVFMALTSIAVFLIWREVKAGVTRWTCTPSFRSPYLSPCTSRF